MFLIEAYCIHTFLYIDRPPISCPFVCWLIQTASMHFSTMQSVSPSYTYCQPGNVKKTMIQTAKFILFHFFLMQYASTNFSTMTPVSLFFFTLTDFQVGKEGENRLHNWNVCWRILHQKKWKKMNLAVCIIVFSHWQTAKLVFFLFFLKHRLLPLISKIARVACWVKISASNRFIMHFQSKSTSWLDYFWNWFFDCLLLAS